MTKKVHQIEFQLNRYLAARTNFPSPISSCASNHSNWEKIEKIAHHLEEIMDKYEAVDLSNDSLRESPRRIAEMYM